MVQKYPGWQILLQSLKQRSYSGKAGDKQQVTYLVANYLYFWWITLSVKSKRQMTLYFQDVGWEREGISKSLRTNALGPVTNLPL